MNEKICAHCNLAFESRKPKKFCSQKCYFASKKKTAELVCQWCSENFELPFARRAQRFCSKACSNSATKRNRIIKKCHQCDAEFEIIAFRKGAQFCSQDCKHTNMRNGAPPTLVKSCENCDEDFELSYSKRKQRFCSYNCSNKGQHNAMYQNREAAKKISEARAREIIDGTRNFQKGYKTGYFESPKTTVKQFYRSSYELRALRKLDADESVAAIQTEALRIPYTFDGIDHVYIPDIMAVLLNGRTKIIEIKASYMRNDPAVQVKAHAARKFCDKLGMTYEIWDENDL